MARSKSFPDSVDPGMPVLPACPNGWTQRRFGDVLRAIERPIVLDEEMTYTLVNAKRSRGGIVLRDRKPGKEVKVPTQFIVREGDFVISRRQIIHGACGIVPHDLDGAIVSNEYLVLNSTDELWTKYLSYFSHTPYFQRTCFHSSVGVDVEKMVFKEDQWFQFPFPLPPLPEQRKIAAILSSVDETIAKTESVIAQLQIVKKAMMEQLLTKGMPGRHTRFKQTEIGEIPEEWEVLPIDDVLTSCTYGISSALTSEPLGIPVLRMGNISEGRLDLSDLKFAPYEIVPETLRLCRGDVLFNRTNSAEHVGKVAYVDTDRKLGFASYLLRLRTNERTDASWFAQVLGSSRMQCALKRIATQGVSQSNINPSRMRELRLLRPPLLEQKEIAALLSSVDHVVEVSQTEIDNLRRVKSALSSSLLSGEIRVIAGVA